MLPTMCTEEKADHWVIITFKSDTLRMNRRVPIDRLIAVANGNIYPERFCIWTGHT